jgi:hypothetical protein
VGRGRLPLGNAVAEVRLVEVIAHRSLCAPGKYEVPEEALQALLAIKFMS